jgi:hypothetical protein
MEYSGLTPDAGILGLDLWSRCLLRYARCALPLPGRKSAFRKFRRRQMGSPFQVRTKHGFWLGGSVRGSTSRPSFPSAHPTSRGLLRRLGTCVWPWKCSSTSTIRWTADKKLCICIKIWHGDRAVTGARPVPGRSGGDKTRVAEENPTAGCKPMAVVKRPPSARHGHGVPLPLHFGCSTTGFQPPQPLPQVKCATGAGCVTPIAGIPPTDLPSFDVCSFSGRYSLTPTRHEESILIKWS